MQSALRIAALAVDIISWLYPLMLAVLAGPLATSAATHVFKVTPLGLIAALPLFYLLWLFLYISLSAIGTTLLSLSFQKPKTLQINLCFLSLKNLRLFLDASRILALYRTGLLMKRLPVLNYIVLSPLVFQWLNKLVLRAYSPSTHIGKRSLMFSRPQDPDLTYVGNNVVIGANCHIVSHTLNTANGKLDYTSEPIEISDNATIGGNTRIGMGVKIGRGAIVEVGSNVLPYTRIGADEVWGGNPAVFLRTSNRNLNRSNQLFNPSKNQQQPQGSGLSQSFSQSSSQLLNSSDIAIDSLELNAIIAKAIRLPPEKITDDLDSQTCMAWDSLAKMTIAATLYDRFAIRIPPDDIFRLDSRRAIQQLIAAHANHSSTYSINQYNFKINQVPINPELLPLHDPEVVTRVLAQRVQLPLAAVDRKILVAATFTAQSISSTLELWCRAFQISAFVDFLEFDQVEQTLLATDSAFLTNTNGLNIVLIRPEDLNSDHDINGMLRGRQLIEAIKNYAARQRGLVVSNLPPAISSFSYGAPPQLEKLRFWWQEQLEQIEGIHVLDFARVIEEVGRQQAWNASLEMIARAPYSPLVYQQLGVAIARLARSVFLPSKKVLALDCDGTLWGGSVGEDGIDGLAISDDHPGRSFRLFQKMLLELKKRGVLLVLVSKNEEADVWQVFEHHPGMVVQRTDIASHRINWQAKSANLRELAKELNLGLNSFVFMDDSPAERLEVETSAPEVTVVPLPEDPTYYVETLAKLWCFDSSNITAEDKIRTQSMLQEQQRQEFQQTAANLEEYLKALNLVVEVRLAEARDLARVAQLTQKTNQFNLSLIRRSISEIQSIRESSSVLTLNVKDRFGDYGLVGVAILKSEDSRLSLDTLLMSCRALGRGAEESFLFTIFEFAHEQGFKQILAPYSQGPRNGQVKTFLMRMGFLEQSSNIFVANVNHAPQHPKHVTLHTQISV